ncbi:hypothetical protein FZEAL_3523 [Fusarium zealandicum]|uniref:Uncharacterized protein n=1 Tax=Fusarium zealandicum TaxID=1053134 RepID=A0A8H4XMV7_9HYPO|nr:hypothetical protein FZEAL_3523 [Fusarium zealandicum]
MGSSTRWLAVAAVVACALLDNTKAIEPPQEGPEPTAPATIGALRPWQAMYRRDDGHTITEALQVTVAPDTLCGYYTPGTSFSFTCSSGRSCMWENDKYNLAFCGIDDIKTACYDQTDALDPDKCDDECRRNPNNQFCTQSTGAFCFTIYFPSGIRKYPCHTASGFSSMIFPDGVENFATSTMGVAIYAAATTQSTASTEESTSSEDSSTESAATEGSTTAGGRPTVTVQSAPQGDEDNAGDTSNSPGRGGGSKSNIGAIVGGVLGGIAVIAALVLIVLFIRRRDKKTGSQAQPQQQMQTQPHLQQQMPYPMMAQQQQQQQQHMPYQGWQQTPPPQGFQQTPSPHGYQQSSSPQGFQQSSSPDGLEITSIVEAPGSSYNNQPVYEMGGGRDRAGHA